MNASKTEPIELIYILGVVNLFKRLINLFRRYFHLTNSCPPLFTQQFHGTNATCNLFLSAYNSF